MTSSCRAAKAEFDYLLLDWPEVCGRCGVHFDKARDFAAIFFGPKKHHGDDVETMHESGFVRI